MLCLSQLGDPNRFNDAKNLPYTNLTLTGSSLFTTYFKIQAFKLTDLLSVKLNDSDPNMLFIVLAKRKTF